MAARAGARTAMIGRVGADDFGARLRENLKVAGVDARCIRADAREASGMSVAIVQDDGDYGAVIVSGANQCIEPGSLESHWRELGGAHVLVLQNEVPEAVNIAAANAAHTVGATVILNAAPARTISSELLNCVEVLVVNRVEAEMYSGQKVADRDDAIDALAKFARMGLGVVVTLGGGGLVVKPANGEPHWIAAKPVKVVSTHGAGDCFVGTLAARIAKSDPLLVAVEVASAAASNLVALSESRA
jgi:ribokinase